MESDLAWAPTHTLINPFTEVVDHSAATSILAAGRVGRSGTIGAAFRGPPVVPEVPRDGGPSGCSPISVAVEDRG